MESTNKKYLKCKLLVKKWESEFSENNGSKPTKADIKNAPQHIKEAYKTYWKLKTISLETSLVDVSFGETDSFEDIPIVPTIADIVACQSDIAEPSNDDKFAENDEKPDDLTTKENFVDRANIIDEQNKLSVENKEKDEKTSSVWGSHLSNVNKKIETKSKPIISSHFTSKLFAGACFKKRNPRKSFIRREKSINDSVIPDENLTNSSISEFGESFSEPSIISFSEDKSLTEQERLRPLKAEELHDISFGKTIKMANQKNVQNNSVQPLSVLQKTLSKTAIPPLVNKNVNTGWLNRLEKEVNIDSVKNKVNSNDSGIEVVGSSLNSFEPKSLLNSMADDHHDNFNCDNEDFVCDSDSGDEKTKSFCSFSDLLKSKPPSIQSSNKDDISIIGNRFILNYANLVNRETNAFKPTKRSISHVDSDLVMSESKRMKINSSELSGGYHFNEKNNSPSFMPNNCTSHQKQNSNLPSKSLNNGIKEQQNVLTPKEIKQKELLKSKMLSGKVNENFVKVNLKKKTYARGKKTMTFQKYKKQKWKEMKNKTNSNSFGVLKCFKCGDIGHFSKNCNKASNQLLPLEDLEDDADDSPFPSLQEAEDLALEASKSLCVRRHVNDLPLHVASDNFDASAIPPLTSFEIDDLSRLTQQEPILKLNEDGSLVETPLMVMEALLKFGHERWRPGQELAIKRVLSGLSTLVTLSTGSGKSLCYQLPAYLYHTMQKRITIVVSPLVSLMEDQVFGVPDCLQIACLHTNQVPKVRESVFERLKANSLHALLISPESLAVGDKLGELLRSLPQVAFACIDEAHCISQWSHNFRPSYLMICQILREKFGVKTILGLTATASVATISSISTALALPDGVEGVIRDVPLPNNLWLSVSRDRNKDNALLTLLKGKRFSECQSIIVYCTRRDECQRLAAFIRTCLQDVSKEDGKAKRGKISWNAEAYHAGLTAARRKSVQKSFMSGKTRIIVATVAFGMGINKRDIEGIIHYNMPSAFEKYVQEVGRAGRDGRTAHCHLFLNTEGSDLCELRRHIYANSVERHTIRKLLQRVFQPCKCGNECPSHEVAFSVDETVCALDLPQENIETLLCYLQLHAKQWVRVCSKVYTQCRIISYKGSKFIRKAAKECPVLAVALAMEAEKGVKLDKLTKIEFSIFNIASVVKWDSNIIKQQLKSLEWTKENNLPRRSGLTVEFYDLGFRVQAPGNLSDAELDSALNSLTSRVECQETTALKKLQAISDILTQISHKYVDECLNNIDDELCEKLKTNIRQYFCEENYLDRHNLNEVEIENEDQIIADIRSLVNSYRDVTFSGRSVARIFHGIGSPNFPPLQWGRCRFWRAHLQEDFKLICKLATRELIKMR